MAATTTCGADPVLPISERLPRTPPLDFSHMLRYTGLEAGSTSSLWMRDSGDTLPLRPPWSRGETVTALADEQLRDTWPFMACPPRRASTCRRIELESSLRGRRTGETAQAG